MSASPHLLTLLAALGISSESATPAESAALGAPSEAAAPAGSPALGAPSEAATPAGSTAPIGIAAAHTIVPWYVPRGVSLGVAFNAPVISPQLRLSWEVGLVEQPADQLVATLIVGSGLGQALPRGMRGLDQHVLLGGIALRTTRGRLHAGLGVSAGVLAYTAAFEPATRLALERRVAGFSDATARLGVKLWPNLALGGQVGYAALWYVDPALVGAAYTGGVTAGLFADWR